MGYITTGSIKSFRPDDTENQFYIAGSSTLGDIIDACQERWGFQVSVHDIKIEPENIHTDCISYDSYDSGDYTNFLCITRAVK